MAIIKSTKANNKPSSFSNTQSEHGKSDSFKGQRKEYKGRDSRGGYGKDEGRDRPHYKGRDSRGGYSKDGDRDRPHYKGRDSRGGYNKDEGSRGSNRRFSDRKTGTFPQKSFGRYAKKDVCRLWGWHAVVAALHNPRRAKGQLTVTKIAFERLLKHYPSFFSEDQKTCVVHPVSIKNKSFFEAFLPNAVHQGCLLETSFLKPANASKAFEDYDETVTPHVLVVLDQVEDPQNIGGLFRNTLAFGGAGIVLPDARCPLLDGALAKVAAGTLEKVPFYTPVNLVQFLKQAQAKGFWCIGLDEKSTPFAEWLAQEKKEGFLTKKMILVVGAEGKGLRPLTRETLDHMVALPTQADFSTLNAATAGAVALALLRHHVMMAS